MLRGAYPLYQDNAKPFRNQTVTTTQMPHPGADGRPQDRAGCPATPARYSMRSCIPPMALPAPTALCLAPPTWIGSVTRTSTRSSRVPRTVCHSLPAADGSSAAHSERCSHISRPAMVAVHGRIRARSASVHSNPRAGNCAGTHWPLLRLSGRGPQADRRAPHRSSPHCA